MHATDKTIFKIPLKINLRLLWEGNKNLVGGWLLTFDGGYGGGGGDVDHFWLEDKLILTSDKIYFPSHSIALQHLK